MTTVHVITPETKPEDRLPTWPLEFPNSYFQIHDSGALLIFRRGVEDGPVVALAKGNWNSASISIEPEVSPLNPKGLPHNGTEDHQS